MIVTLPRALDVSIRARAAVRGFAVELGARRTADACLLVSELVTNAYLYGDGPIRLTIGLRDNVARFCVHDDGDANLQPSPDPGEHGGFGLNIVDRVADLWGTASAPTHVWFELHAPATRLATPLGSWLDSLAASGADRMKLARDAVPCRVTVAQSGPRPAGSIQAPVAALMNRRS